MTVWNPKQYLMFGDERLRPALDLLAQIPLKDPAHIIDLGCGPGNVTNLISQRWQKTAITGLDQSGEMLDKARKHYDHIQWQQGDVATWQPDNSPDLIYSNACLHWLGDHQRLFPRLLQFVKPGGVLAVQMPNNFRAPTHQLVEHILNSENWPEKARAKTPGTPVHDPAFYYEMLEPYAAHINMWETTYLHVLEGCSPVASWAKGTTLRPILDAMENEEQRNRFENAYRLETDKAYPKTKESKTLLPFKRFFMVITRD